MKEQRNKKKQCFLPGSGGRGEPPLQNSKCILSLIIFSRAVHPSPLPHGLSPTITPSAGGGRADGSSRLRAQRGRASPARSEAGSAVWAPRHRPPAPIPAPSSARSSLQRLPTGCGDCRGKAHCPFTPIPSLTAPRRGRSEGRGEKGDRKQRGVWGGKGGEQEKQDDRTLAPQPSAKLQTSLLRWKAAVS